MTTEEPIEFELEAQVARADIIYRAPAGKSTEGLPIGNGRMGTLVWTVPEALCVQINRADVFAVNRGHQGAHMGPTDYCGACAQLAILPGQMPFGPDDHFKQSLHVFDGTVKVESVDLRAEAFISATRDLMMATFCRTAVATDPVYVHLHLWRPTEVRQGRHAALYRFETRTSGVVVTQTFTEDDYYCQVSVAVAASEGSCEISAPDNVTWRICLRPVDSTNFTIWTSSSASRDRDVDTAALAWQVIEDARRAGLDTLKREHRRWWQSFWGQSFLWAHSQDQVADFLERLHTYYLYLMAVTSRADLPPKFNGMLWLTDGDKRMWGSKYWMWNEQLLYFAMPAANQPELMAPYLKFLAQILPALRANARNSWDCRGLLLPEVFPFDGPLSWEGVVGQDVRDFLRRRKPAEALAPATHQAVQWSGPTLAHPSHVIKGYSWITHILSNALEIGLQLWTYYRMTGDRQLLATLVYPYLKGGVEFYLDYARLEADGCYHISPTNIHEAYWGARDGMPDLAALRGAIPLAILASEILAVDADERPRWRAFLERLTPYPLGSEPEAQGLESGVLTPECWAAGRLGEIAKQINREQIWLMPVFPFEHVTLATPNPALRQVVAATYERLPYRQELMRGKPIALWTRLPILTARMGHTADMRWLPAALYATSNSACHGLDNEGAQALSVETLAAIAAALQDALLQAMAPNPGDPEIIFVLPAWPREWEVAFKLLARGGFLVTGACRQGALMFVKVESRRGERLRLRNPWAGHPVALFRNDVPVGIVTGETIELATQPGECLFLTDRTGVTPADLRWALSADWTEPVTRLAARLPDGQVIAKTLGK